MLKNKIALLPLFLLGCDRSGDDLVPTPDGDFPSVIEIGELSVMSSEDLYLLKTSVLSGSNGQEWCKTNLVDGTPQCFYGILGESTVDVKGGATLTFKGTGGPVCLMVDPEAVFWNTAVAAQRPEKEYKYPDYEEDDGDIDIFAGLSSYYTGSPGIELGNFKGFYTDSLGGQVEIEYGECFQFGSQSGMNNAHAGRAMPEYCTINTDNRAGVEYTAVLETFSIPLDDGSLGFSVAVVNGSCTDLSVNECSMIGESQKAERDGDGKVKADDSGNATTYTTSCTRQMEQASCNGTLLEFCCAYPDMCGEDPTESVLGSCEAYNDPDAVCGNPELSYLCCGSDTAE
jgi:hypothetical protein